MVMGVRTVIVEVIEDGYGSKNSDSRVLAELIKNGTCYMWLELSGWSDTRPWP